MIQVSKRIITGLVLAALVLITVMCLPGLVALLLLSMVAGIAYYELLAMYSGQLVHLLLSCCFMLAALMLFINMPEFISLQALIVMLFSYYIYRYGCNLNALQSKVTLLVTLYSVCLVAAAWAIVALYQKSPLLVLALIGITAISDIGGYFTGTNFGRRLFIPMLSPGKTYAGVLGGFISVIIVSTIIAYSMSLQILTAITITSLTACFAVIGDFIVSWLKRLAQVKDSGTILPGHGGVLDRIDSLVLSAPFFWIAIQYY